MGTDSSAGTEGAACWLVSSPVVQASLPLVREAERAAVTDPPHLPATARFDCNIVKVSILVMVPLALQLWA